MSATTGTLTHRRPLSERVIERLLFLAAVVVRHGPLFVRGDGRLRRLVALLLFLAFLVVLLRLVDRLVLLCTSAKLGPAQMWADRAATVREPVLPGLATRDEEPPLVIDIDEPGRHFDAGWTSADQRTAARRARSARLKC